MHTHDQCCTAAVQYSEHIPYVVRTASLDRLRSRANALILRLRQGPLYKYIYSIPCAVGNLTADEIVVTGGKVTEIIPVPHTYYFFVWLQVDSGAGSLHIAVNSGEALNKFLSVHHLI